MTRRWAVAAVTFSALTTGTLANADGWRQIGPPGGFVDALLTDPCHPARVWAATRSAGVFRSDDGGRSWVARNAGLANLETTALALDSGECDSLLLGVRLLGAYRSTDAGETWVPARDGLESYRDDFTGREIVLYPYSITFMRGQRGHAAAITSGYQIREWSDETREWTALGSYDRADKLAAVPSQEDVLLLSQRVSVSRSTDGGRSFETSLELPKGIVAAMVSFPAGETWVATSEGLLYVSGDGGLSWRVMPQPPAWPYGFQYDAAAQTYYAAGSWGLYRRQPMGTWALINEQARVTSFSASPDSAYALVNGEHLIARWPEGVARCPAADAPCEPANQGIPSTSVDSVALEPDRGRVYALDSMTPWGRRCHRFDDASGTWEVLAPPRDGHGRLAFGPGPHALLYSFGGGLSGLETLGVSHDAGHTWEWAGPPSEDQYPHVRAVAFPGHRHDAVVAATSDGVWRSENAGGSWERLLDGDSWVVAVDPRNSHSIWAGGTVMFRSLDGGATWITIAGGPETYPGSGEPAVVRNLAVAPWDSRVAVALFDASCRESARCLSVTRDGGLTWVEATSPVRWRVLGVAMIAPGAATPGRIVASATVGFAEDQGVWESGDLGQSWSRVTDFFTAYPADLVVAATGPTSRRWAIATHAGVWLLDESLDPARPPRRHVLR